MALSSLAVVVLELFRHQLTFLEGTSDGGASCHQPEVTLSPHTRYRFQASSDGSDGVKKTHINSHQQCTVTVLEKLLARVVDWSTSLGGGDPLGRH